MAGEREPWRAGMRRAVAVGIVGGVVLGMRDGLATVAANAFADARHHAVAYLVVPVAVWSVMAPSLLASVALLTQASGGVSTPTLAGLLAGFGTALALLPALEDAVDEMRATGAEPSFVVWLLMATFAAVLVATAAGVVRAAGKACAGHGVVASRAIVAACIVVGFSSLAWTGRFLSASLTPPDAQAAPSAASSVAPPAGAPNVLVVSIDTLRADELGTYGGRARSSPALDRLAAEGVTFERAISPSPWTLPAIASIMTGLYPRHHGAGAVVNPHDPIGRSPLAPGTPTLAATLASHGYRTHAIVTNPYLLARSGLAHGFHGYENLTFLSEAMLSGRRNGPQWLLDNLAPRLTVGDRGAEVSERAARWIEAVDGTRPFFLWLHYLDPHGPYERANGSRHKTFRGETKFGARSQQSGRSFERSPDPVRLRSGELRLGPDQKAAVRELYRAEVTEVDRQIGRVLDALDARGLARRTIVLCVSDHGEEFWDHGGVEHGHTLYDELIRAVLIVRWPERLPAGHRVALPVSTVDVAPTLHDLVGIRTVGRSDGRSLGPAMRGEPMLERPLLSENLLFAEEKVALRTGKAKLVRWANGKVEAYDLTNDPAEQRDLAGVEGFVDPLRAELDRLEQTMVAAAAPSGAVAIPSAALRALGYVQ